MKNNIFILSLGLGLATLFLTSSSCYAQRGRGGHMGNSMGRVFNGGMGSSNRGLYSSPRLYSNSFTNSYNSYSTGIHNRFYTRPRIGVRYYATLPFGYWGFNFRGAPYYYYSGIYYRPYKKQYQVVEPPIGATVPQIPSDAKEVYVNNQKYYEYNGTYYKQVVNQDGNIWYLVAGLHGVLNTTNNSVDNKAEAAAVAPEVTVSTIPSALKVGDIVPNLPDGCKTVIIHNKKYYVSPSNIYYEEYFENNTLMYKVVGN
jgi:hypothetical protein